MRIPRPAMLSVAAGVLVIAGGTAGLLSTQGTAAQPPTGPAPTTSIVRLPTPQTPTEAASGVLQSSYPTPAAPGAVGSVPAPTSIYIPAIKLRAKLLKLGRSGDSLNTDPLNGQPRALEYAGWDTSSVRPGQIGPAVIAGHIDWGGVDGVFWYLNELRKGDLVYITRAGGSTVEFQVTRMQEVPKTELPTQEVFGPTPDAELRLITCDGSFDYATGHYLSNLIVYAKEV